MAVHYRAEGFTNTKLIAITTHLIIGFGRFNFLNPSHKIAAPDLFVPIAVTNTPLVNTLRIGGFELALASCIHLINMRITS